MTIFARVPRDLKLKVLGSVILTGGISACSTGPELRVDMAPAEPAVIDGVQFLPSDDARVIDAVTTELQRRNVGEAGEWQLEVALAVRPADIGTYTDTSAREGDWAETPRPTGARREPGLYVLTVLATRKDGADRRLVRVSGRGPLRETSPELLDSLSRMAVDALIDGAPQGNL